MVDTLPIKIKEELDFLRWFYINIEDSLGPASKDIYDKLRKRYAEKTGKKTPNIKRCK